MGLLTKKPDSYDEVDKILQNEKQKAISEGDWAKFDEMQKRQNDNHDAWNKRKTITSFLDKAGRGAIIARIVGGTFIGALVLLMIKSEKIDGDMLSGSNSTLFGKIVGVGTKTLIG